MRNEEELIETAKVSLANGWRGLAVVCDDKGHRFSKSDWLTLLAEPESLLDGASRTIKREDRNVVAVKELCIGSKRVKTVIKRHQRGRWVREFFRSLGCPRAMQNFRAAVKTARLGLPVAAPLAAVYRRTFLFCSRSIYISEYVDGVNLYEFLKNLPRDSKDRFLVISRLSDRLAEIFTSLHRNGLWHRDAKATNFVVSGNGLDNYRLVLTDMDGIKQYFVRRKTCQMRALWRLAASVMPLSSVRRADYLRVFKTYCEKTGLPAAQRANIFRQLVRKAQAKQANMIHQPKNILIIKPSALGDIVLALPAFATLKRSFPKARISWLVRPEFAELLRGHPDLDELIPFDRRLLGKSLYSPKAFVCLVGLLRRLREERFDVVFDFQGLFRTGFIGWIIGCRRRFGMSQAREFAYLFYTDKIPQDYSCVHLVDYYLRIVAAAGAGKTDVRFALPQNPSAVEAVKKLLAGYGVSPGNYAVLVPVAARENKRWPIEAFAKLAEKIVLQFGWSIVATGAPAERKYVQTLQDIAKVSVVNFAGQTSVAELVALLRGASFVVSNDTGPGHIAAALGVPIVMIFGPTNPARVCPYNRPECAVAVEPDKRGHKADSHDPKHDIRHITVERVFEKVCEQIEKRWES
jgi:heptosyltransferase I